MQRGLILGLCGSILIGTSAASAATEVTTCGQTVSGNAFLSGDLDCSGAVDNAVILDGGKLDLRGFTLTAAGVGLGNGVRCERSCTVRSEPPGGMIVGGLSIGVLGESLSPIGQTVNLRLEGVIIDGLPIGVVSVEGNILLIDSTVRNATVDGVIVGASGKRAKLVRSTVENNAGVGVGAFRSQVIDSTVQNNAEHGVRGTRSLVRGSTIAGNTLDGLNAGQKIKITDSMITGNGGNGAWAFIEGDIRVVRSDVSGNGATGVTNEFAPLTVIDSTITNNGEDGLRTQNSHFLLNVIRSTVTGNGRHGIYDTTAEDCSVTLEDTVATGNGTGVNCGVSETCADVASCDVPQIKGTSTCDTSYVSNSGFPGTTWGICALD